MGLRRLSLVLACAACATPMSGCFLKNDEEGEARREGLDVRVGGIGSNVDITRELNPRGLPDCDGHGKGRKAKPGHPQDGLFPDACNRSVEDDDHEDDNSPPTDQFVDKDTQQSEYEPLEAEEDNVF